jgi:hypothetical protein
VTILAFPTPYTPFRGFANEGTPLSGGLLYSYAAGTNTPLVTYQDPGIVAPNANPTVLNARGEAPVFLLPNVAYKFLLTDFLGNTIPGWPIDNIVNSVLITLYGGVDTGVTNAYVLTFNASFQSLANGIVIYWVPANANTGASTVSVNGLGVINLVNPDGSALSANQILAGQPIQMMYYNGNFILLNGTFVPGALIIGSNLSVTGNLAVTGNGVFGSAGAHIFTAYAATAAAQMDVSPDKGTFTGTLSGMTAATTGTFNWIKMGPFACIYAINAITGTSNNVNMGLTGMPASIIPANNTVAQCSGGCQDNSVNGLDAVCAAQSNGTFILGLKKVSGANITVTTANWTNSGTKGITGGFSIVYPLV